MKLGRTFFEIVTFGPLNLRFNVSNGRTKNISRNIGFVRQQCHRSCNPPFSMNEILCYASVTLIRTFCLYRYVVVYAMQCKFLNDCHSVFMLVEAVDG